MAKKVKKCHICKRHKSTWNDCNRDKCDNRNDADSIGHPVLNFDNFNILKDFKMIELFNTPEEFTTSVDTNDANLGMYGPYGYGCD